MDILQQPVDHHVDSLAALITAADEAGDDVLDRPITSSVQGIDDDPTLRGVLNAMVTQEEHWLAALRGGEWPDETDQSIDGLRARHAEAEKDHRAFVASSIADGRLADLMVDTTCEPTKTHAVGAIIAHVITFAAVRRTPAVGALWSAGHQDIALADPRQELDRLADSPARPDPASDDGESPQAWRCEDRDRRNPVTRRTRIAATTT